MNNRRNYETSRPLEYPRTALVVDDEPAILELLAMILTLRGCKVCTAQNGAQALVLAADAGREPFDVVITDVCMPDMNGVQLAMELRELQPAINVIFASGYSAGEIAAMGLDLRGLPVVCKPFQLRDVDQALGALSNRAPATCRLNTAI